MAATILKISAAKVCEFKAIFQLVVEGHQPLTLMGWNEPDDAFPLGSWTFSYNQKAVNPEVEKGFRFLYGEWNRNLYEKG